MTPSFLYRTPNKWDKYFIKMCDLASSLSKDLNTQVGCVIIGPDHEIRSTGYNSFPRGINDLDRTRQERPKKYFFFEHAERNAIYNAARVGVPLAGCTLYVPWHPCADCARAIIQSGIRVVITETIAFPEHWTENCLAANEMFVESGVVICSIDEKLKD